MKNYTLFLLMLFSTSLKAMEEPKDFWAEWHKQTTEKIEKAKGIQFEKDKSYMYFNDLEKSTIYRENIKKALPSTGTFEEYATVQWSPQVEMMLHTEKEIEKAIDFLKLQKMQQERESVQQKGHKVQQELQKMQQGKQRMLQERKVQGPKEYSYSRTLYAAWRKVNSYGIADHLITFGAGGVASWYLIKYGKLLNQN